ncbi:hypothetical protein V8E53_006006 [Lactarius tabidus]
MMASLLNMFTGGGTSKKKEDRKRYGPNLGIPSPTSPAKSPTSPNYPPSSPGPATTKRTPSVSQPQGTYPNWGNSGPPEPTPQPAPPPISPPNIEDDEVFAWFTAIDQDGSGQVSAEELQSALISGYGGKRFSTETVRYLMSVFDLDASGEIGIEEFKPLWDYVKQWREMFESFDDNQDGIIDAGELSNALQYYKLEVGPLVISFLIHKYGTTPQGHNGPPQIELDRFVCACVVVQQMSALYDRCGAGRATDRAAMEVSRDEFLLAILRLP